MILSSADILAALGADAIIRQEARLVVVEGRPGIDTGDTVYIYVEKYPTIDEFEATWKIWVQDNSGMGKYVLDVMTSLLPNFDFKGSYYTTTDFASDRTVIKTREEIDREEFKDRFSGLQKGLEERLGSVRDGVDGKDGKDGTDGLPGRDGRDGADGRDGKDLVATEAELFDLQDVEQVLQMERGQVLTWDGVKWTNLFIPQIMATGHEGGGNGGTGSIEKLDDIGDVTITNPADGNVLAYQAGEWVNAAAPPADISGSSINQLSDVDTATNPATNGQTLVWDGSNWVPSSDYATSAQGALADTATQPGDNVSTLSNDAGYITAGEVPAAPVTSVNSQTGVVVLDKTDIGLGNVDNTSDVNKPISTATQAALDLKADLVNGVVPNSQLPAIAVTEYLGAAANESAMLALSGQQGDWCIRTDLGSTWVITGPDPTQVNDWVELAHPADAVTSVNGYVGAVSLSASDVGAATAAQGALADSAVQPGDNVSDLVNDAGYITAGQIPPDSVVSVNGDTGAVVVDLDSATTQGATTSNNLSVGDLLTVQGDGAAQEGRLKLNCSANTHGVTIQSPPHSDAATYTLTLPSTAGTAGQVLTSQGGAQLTWEDAATGGGGGGSGAGIYLTETQIASSGVATFVGLGYSGILQKVTSDLEAWIVLYSSAAERAADASRAYDTDPTPGSGVLFEAYVTAGGTVVATPGTTYLNNDTTLTEAIYAAVRDQTGTAVNASVTFSAYGLAAITAINGGTFGSGL